MPAYDDFRTKWAFNDMQTSGVNDQSPCSGFKKGGKMVLSVPLKELHSSPSHTDCALFLENKNDEQKARLDITWRLPVAIDSDNTP